MNDLRAILKLKPDDADAQKRLKALEKKAPAATSPTAAAKDHRPQLRNRRRSEPSSCSLSWLASARRIAGARRDLLRIFLSRSAKTADRGQLARDGRSVVAMAENAGIARNAALVALDALAFRDGREVALEFHAFRPRSAAGIARERFCVLRF